MLDWELFAHTYLAGWLMPVLLSMIGVVVVARDQIFIGAAIAQASTLGIAATMVGAGAIHVHVEHEHHWLVAVAAIIMAVLASLLTAGSGRIGRESHEAVTGWVFLVASALSVLVVWDSPHAMEEVHRLLSSSLIGATAADVWMLAVLSGVGIAALAAIHRPLRLLIMDGETAAALGMGVRRWNLGVALWLGATVGISLHIGGLLYTFGCLVLPALLAKNVCRRMGPMFIVAPLAGLAAAVVGLLLAGPYDLPPAQVTVALLGGALGGAWLVRRAANR